MLQSVSKSLWLLAFSVVLVCGIYPQILWGVGQFFFPFQAMAALSMGRTASRWARCSWPSRSPRTSTFSRVRPRPSYDATASSSSALAPSNYAAAGSGRTGDRPVAV